jgi:tetratricopeptide (TPR) repeat protein
VEKLVGEAFNRLDQTAEKVMQALAIYNRQVGPAAVDFLLQPYLPSIDSALVLNRLVNMHFARRDSGKYYLHTADREYALSTIPETQADTAFSRHDLALRAADYFAQARKPRTEWKKLEDVAAQLAEFDLRCTAEDFNTAASVLNEIDSEYLLQWGHYHLLIEMHLLVKDKIADFDLRMANLNGLGLAYISAGKTKEAIDSYQQGLEVARKAESQYWEVSILSNLGGGYLAIGNVEKAIEVQQQALSIAQKIGDRINEGVIYGNLGDDYSLLGDMTNAIKFSEQALAIARELESRYIETAILNNIGHDLLALGNYDEAVDKFNQSIKISDDISAVQAQNYARWGMAKAYLFQDRLALAKSAVEDALAYDVPENNHNTTTLRGMILLRQGDAPVAALEFRRAIAQADEILAITPEFYDALDAKGLALSGLAISQDPKDISDAIEMFHRARKIASHAGIIDRAQRLLDELATCDQGGLLKDVRKAVAGN